MTYFIEAQDGADEDGGTLYTLYDERNEIVASCAWPMPLELLARAKGFSVRRRRPVMGGHDDLTSHAQHEQIVARILAIPPRPLEEGNPR